MEHLYQKIERFSKEENQLTLLRTISPNFNKKILIIGGSGYIGSFLRKKLPYDLSSVDIEWFDNNESISVDFSTLSESFLSEQDVIILLAGHSSVKMCQGDYMNAFNNNVVNFLKLINKIKLIEKRIKLIYASSSSVYGMTGDLIVDENYNSFIPYNNYDITKHIIDVYAEFSGVEYYGLRFGTVNGYSPIMRSDVMINSMTTSALNTKKIQLYVKDTLRPILGINDLTSAIIKIIEEPKDLRGHYNLASFNSTSEKIAMGVSKITGADIIEMESPNKNPTNKLESKNYNFSINCDKFIKNFDFKFEETIESITKSIVDNFENIKLTIRDKIIKYEL
jgi:nucleoside-diphosphate-sugar epimerase